MIRFFACVPRWGLADGIERSLIREQEKLDAPDPAILPQGCTYVEAIEGDELKKTYLVSPQIFTRERLVEILESEKYRDLVDAAAVQIVREHASTEWYTYHSAIGTLQLSNGGADTADMQMNVTSWAPVADPLFEVIGTATRRT